MQDQNSVQMYHLISNWITKAAHLKIVAEFHKYIVQVITVVEGLNNVGWAPGV